MNILSDSFKDHHAKLKSSEGDIRYVLIEVNFVGCMVVRSGPLFASIEKLNVALAA